MSSSAEPAARGAGMEEVERDEWKQRLFELSSRLQVWAFGGSSGGARTICVNWRGKLIGILRFERSNVNLGRTCPESKGSQNCRPRSIPKSKTKANPQPLLSLQEQGLELETAESGRATAKAALATAERDAAEKAAALRTATADNAQLTVSCCLVFVDELLLGFLAIDDIPSLSTI